VKLEFFIQYTEIKAMLNLVPSDDVRHALCGLNFEFSNGRLLLVATDGRRLGVLKSNADLSGGSESLSVTVHRDQLAMAAQKKMANKQGGLFFAIEKEDGKPASISIQCGNFILKRGAVDAAFPTWRQVVPKTFDQGDFAFNAWLFDGFHKVAQTLGGGTNIRIRGGGFSAYQIEIPSAPNFYGILMPIRVDPDSKMTTPSWLNL
jgi:hypothetical protein